MQCFRLYFLWYILVSAGAERGELNAADWRFIFLIAYPPMGLVLAWILSLCAAAFRDCRFGAHGSLARLARCELDVASRF